MNPLVRRILATARQRNPNIIVTVGDDIGIWKISAHYRGMMDDRAIRDTERCR